MRDWDEWQRAQNDDGQTFVFADEGEGPLVVLLHGFPDTPHGWAPAAKALNAAGYRTVRPWLRGYHPETLVPGRGYDEISTAHDAIGLLDALGERRALIVGHDWGALIAYAAANLEPERLIAIVAVGLPHFSLFPRNAGLAWGARHFFVHRIPGIERFVRRNEFAYLDHLYSRWAPAWRGAARDACLTEAKRCFSDPRNLSGALDYYRGFSLNPPAAIAEPPKARGLVVGGTTDSPGPLYKATAAEMGDAEALICEGSGHWPHREAEATFHEALISFAGGLRP